MGLTPDLVAIGNAFFALIASESLYQHVLPSVARVGAALLISTAIGVPIGFAATQKYLGGPGISGLVSAIRYLPPTAFIGLIVLALGIGPQAAIALMVLGVAPYIAIMTADAFRAVPRELVDVARVFGATRREVFDRVSLPFVLPRIIEAVRVNVGAAWTFLVAAEIIAGNSGIGFLIARAQRFLEVQDLYALLLLCGLFGLLMDRMLAIAVAHTSRWGNHAFD